MSNQIDNIQLNPRKFVAPEFVFGIDTRLMAGIFCKKLGARKVLLVTDEGITQTPWLNEIKNNLQLNSVEYIIFSSISPNPRDYEIMEGRNIFKENNCNLILAIGGGSVMDCAKGIGIVSSNNGNIHDYEGVDMINKPIPPLICIPTTGGSAADVSQFAIINNTTEKYKFSIISKAVIPDVALIDPLVLTSMNHFLSACTGMDALTHSIEAFVSNANSAFTDLYSLESIKLINTYLKESVQQPNDTQLRGKIMLASLYAGLAFSNASLGCAHSLAHSLGGYLDLPHGECNAILLPHVVNFNFDSAPDRFIKIAETLNISKNNQNKTEIKKHLFNYLNNLNHQLGIFSSLKDNGVTSDIIPLLATNAIKDPCNATNPKPPTKNDLKFIYAEAM